MIIGNNKPLALIGYPESITIKEIKHAIEEEYPDAVVTVITPEQACDSLDTSFQYLNLAIKQDFIIRKKITKLLDDHNADRFTYIHPSAVVQLTGSNFEPGAVIGPLVGIGFGTTLKKDSMILAQAGIAHGCNIGVGSYVSGQACLGGSVTVGDFCFIGMRVVVYDKKTITDDVTISVASVVRKDITDPGVYHGNPAKKLRLIKR